MVLLVTTSQLANAALTTSSGLRSPVTLPPTAAAITHGTRPSASSGRFQRRGTPCDEGT